MLANPVFEFFQLAQHIDLRGESIPLNFTKTRTTNKLISIARWELGTFAAIITPCSVNASGK